VAPALPKILLHIVNGIFAGSPKRAVSVNDAREFSARFAQGDLLVTEKGVAFLPGP